MYAKYNASEDIAQVKVLPIGFQLGLKTTRCIVDKKAFTVCMVLLSRDKSFENP